MDKKTKKFSSHPIDIMNTCSYKKKDIDRCVLNSTKSRLDVGNFVKNNWRDWDCSNQMYK